jgi:hypothetical protein
MIFMLLKIKIIASIFNKIRLISLYSKFRRGESAKFVRTYQGAYESVQMRTKRWG